MQPIAPLIYDLAIMLGIAGIVVLLFQRIRQPVVLGYLVAGMIIGPHTPPYSFIRDTANIHILSELGVIFLMFYLGLEFSFQKLTRVGFSATFTGVIEVIFMTAIGYTSGRLIGWGIYPSLFLGAALSISSTTIIIKAIEELHLKTKRFSELIFGILIIEDLLAILILVALSTIVFTQNVFSFDMLDAVIRLILVVGSWFLVGYFLMPPLFRNISNYISQETLTIISVALCLILVCIAANFRYSSALGAFIMGSILAETTLVHRIVDLIKPIRDIFAAVFFITVGMLMNPVVLLQNWLTVLFLSIVTIFGKLLCTTVASLVSGESIRNSLRVGFSMAQIGEFSFIIAGLGMALNIVDDTFNAIIVAISGITTFTTPYLIRLSQSLSTTLEAKLPDKIKFVLGMYAAWVYRIFATTGEPHRRQIIVRFCINAIVVALIFSSIHYLAFHYDNWFSEQSWEATTSFLLLSLLCASPFIWGMVFSYRLKTKPKQKKARVGSTVFFIWILTLLEVCVLSFIYFTAWSTVILFLVLTLVFFFLSYRHLELFYRWFEHHLVKNIRGRHPSKFKTLAPWDTHLSEVIVAANSPLVNLSLASIGVRDAYGINIVSIQRGSQIINAPRGNAKLMAQDKIIILGDDEQLDVFRREVETNNEAMLAPNLLHKFKLHAFILDKHHRFVGQTIKQTNMREIVNGLVVGLERRNARILNPASDTVLQANDLVLLVGEASKLNKFKKDVFNF